MNYKFYYYEEEKMCFLVLKKDEKPLIENIENDSLILRISIEDKSVENMYNFFKTNTVFQILSNEPKIIEIDYCDIEKLDFYNQDNFQKLKDLIEQAKNKCNKAIEEFVLKS